MANSSHTTSSIKARLRALGASHFQLSRPEAKVLAGLLFNDEVIEAYVMGNYEGGYGMLVATKHRLLFVDSLFTGTLIVEDVPYTMVSSTEFRLGIFLGAVTVYCRQKKYRLWWLNKRNVVDFYQYVERQMLLHQKEVLED